MQAADIPVDDVFHPLAKLDSQWVKSETEPRFGNDARPVLLNDAIYIQGSNSNGSDEIIWKYSISKRAWSPITPPEDVDIYHSLIAAYQSQLLLVGAKLNQALKVYHFDEENGWSEMKNIVIPSDDNRQSPSDLAVTSEGNNLFISWFKDYRFKVLIFDGQNWKKVEGPEYNTRVRPSAIAHEGTLYLSDLNLNSIYSVPLNSLDDRNIPWKKLPDVPRKHMLPLDAAVNLTFLNSSCLATVVPSLSGKASHVLALDPCTKSWMELGEIPCYLEGDGGRFTVSPKIVGLPCGSVGNVRFLVTRKHVGVLNPATMDSFAVLEVSSIGMLPFAHIGMQFTHPQTTRGSHNPCVCGCIIFAC